MDRAGGPDRKRRCDRIVRSSVPARHAALSPIAVNKSQALLIAKTIKETAAQLAAPKRDR
jgi:hypothetical protein